MSRRDNFRQCLLIRVIAICLSHQGMCIPLWYDDANWAPIESLPKDQIFFHLYPQGQRELRNYNTLAGCSSLKQAYFVMVKIGIAGASGYTGLELIRLLAGHPDVQSLQFDL